MTDAVLDMNRLRIRAADPDAAPPTGRPASETLTLGAGSEQFPTATELAALLPRVPVREVLLTGTVDISGTDDRTAARAIALVRECSSIGARVTWSLALEPSQLELVRRLDHLPAPERATIIGQRTIPLGEWRSTNHFGLFYFRKGPTFLSVVEQRAESDRRLIVNDPAEIEVLRRGLDGCAWAELAADARQATAAADMVNAGLLLRVGEHCVTLPVHMRSWPIGAKLLTGTLASAGPKQAAETGDAIPA
ncbi:DUF5825 family protein [Jatrophihabitans lederbergiae]|uniref:DUF5825 family protein n=1 Tax=Jatrophihabitans lederbergiae TaxID=3075547 RepID=A0ABU2JHF7_9ACTN|nr:DUF5825 family protein [Jatrophihabitans sp. DSM 44399]MDT0264367.1 DUF5825 family protein [Jatrophihabitans sp. DSM 44399]